MDISLVCWRCGQELKVRPSRFPVGHEDLAQLAGAKGWLMAADPASGHVRTWCSEACRTGSQPVTALRRPASGTGRAQAG